jgi:hypothetical protein
MQTNFCSEELKGRDYSEGVSVVGRVKLDLKVIGWSGTDLFNII